MVVVTAEVGCRLLLSEYMQDGFSWRGVTVVNSFAAMRRPLLDALMGETGPKKPRIAHGSARGWRRLGLIEPSRRDAGASWRQAASMRRQDVRYRRRDRELFAGAKQRAALER